jgi:hypothetical protein
VRGINIHPDGVTMTFVVSLASGHMTAIHASKGHLEIDLMGAGARRETLRLAADGFWDRRLVFSCRFAFSLVPIGKQLPGSVQSMARLHPATELVLLETTEHADGLTG